MKHPGKTSFAGVIGKTMRGFWDTKPIRRITALGMIYVLLHSQGVGLIQTLRAETAGGTAPEVTKFEPVDTTDLVNLASGDFTYNIPIINVPGPEGGYPLSLNYHAGIQQGEEASWVGLGWNLQPGSITRGLKGYPDDYKNEPIFTNYRSNVYETLSESGTFFFVTVGQSYNTYKGYNGYVGIGVSVGAQAGYWGAGASAMAGVGYSQENGAYLLGNASAYFGPFSANAHSEYYFNSGKTTTNLSASFTPFSFSGSRFGPSYTVSTDLKNTTTSVGFVASYSHMGTTLDSKGEKISVPTGQSGSASYGSYSGGGQHSETFGLGINIAVFGGSLSYTRYWIDEDKEEHAYGYFYHHLKGQNDPNRVNEWSMESDPNALPGDSKEHALSSGLNYLLSSDAYGVMGQGTGGALKLSRREDRVYRPRKVSDEWYEAGSWPWGTTDGQPARFVFEGDNTEIISSPDYIGLTQAQLAALVKDPSQGSVGQNDFAKESATLNSIFLGKEYSSLGGGRFARAGFKDRSGIVGTKFQSFDIWEMDGKRYTYGEPLWNYWSQTISANVPNVPTESRRIVPTTLGWTLGIAGVPPSLIQNSLSPLGLKGFNIQGTGPEWLRSTTTVPTPYAYAWYLTELRYPDYWDVTGDGLTSDDRGGWVRFGYRIGADYYRWHTSPDENLSDGPINRIDHLGREKAGMMYSMQFGAKQIKYLNTIDTATHRAVFSTSSRLDSREIPRGEQVPVGTMSSGQNGVFHFTSSTAGNLNLLGLSFESTGWNQTSHVLGHDWVSGTCAGNTDTTTTYEYSQPGMVMTIKGVPVVVSKVTKTVSKRYVSRHDLQTGEYWCDERNDDSFDVEINLADQFWKLDNSIPKAFESLRTTWDQDIQGKLIDSAPKSMLQLTDIYLLEKSTNKLVKQVHFNYTYELAQGAPNSDAGAGMNPYSGKAYGAKGKLTLVSVQSFGQGGMDDPESKTPPYIFSYANNPTYGNKYSYDRWGFHKSDGGPWRHRDVNASDQSAWCLTKIIVPTGGSIQIQYEPKDYARVQDRIPLNPKANQPGMISNYLMDIGPLVGGAAWPDGATTNWPSSPTEWAAFKTRLSKYPLHLFPAGGTNSGGTAINAVTTTLPKTAIPIQSAPNPLDLKLWLRATGNQAYQAKSANSENAPGTPIRVPLNATKISGLSVADSALPLPPKEALNAEAATTVPIPIERMVTFVMEFWTAGGRAQKRMTRPLKPLEPGDVAGEGEDDRGDAQIKSVLARMQKASDGGADLFVVDPDFEWPAEAPHSIYTTWTANPATPKIGGGVRVKRIVSWDGRKSFSTSYTYRDLVDGTWTTSGVAATEPPPYGYSADDDRVIQTEKGGWVNEKGGGIYHSRVIVRHGWSETPNPAGVEGVMSPLGESVFRFITPADVPHRQNNISHAVTSWRSPDGAYHTVTDANPLPTDQSQISEINTNSARFTEIMNVGSWWGQLLWREDRDMNGAMLSRIEQDYAQLEGYLRLVDPAQAGRTAGYDPDVEKAWTAARQSDMSYVWAKRNNGGKNWQQLVSPTTENLANVGIAIPNSDPGYLNASIDISLMASVNNQRRFGRYSPTLAWKTGNQDLFPDWYDDSEPQTTGWHSSISGVREISIPPLLVETRTFGEGQHLMAATRTTKVNARTGAPMEIETRGRRTGVADAEDPWAGHDKIVTRTWPAYWMYAGMDSAKDPNVEAGQLNSIKNMLNQSAQVTTLRAGADGSEAFLNSKVDTWGQRDEAPLGGRWMKGGEFVWNGLGAQQKPSLFSGFTEQWNPSQIGEKGIQPYKTSGNWIFVGATTAFDDFAHALEAVDGDGIYGCSKYGYPYDNTGLWNLPPTQEGGSGSLLRAGTMPVAKFSNAKDAETLYWNFEGPSTAANVQGLKPMPLSYLTQGSASDPIGWMAIAYTGEHAHDLSKKVLEVPLPGFGPEEFEFRCFVKASSAAEAQAIYPTQGEIISVTEAEGGWWFLRARAKRSAGSSRSLTGPGRYVDDVAVFPWRNQGAPVSVSHFAYDRGLGLISSITGSNGRTTRYQYDRLGRLVKVYDVYGKPTASTRYAPAASNIN